MWDVDQRVRGMEVKTHVTPHCIGVNVIFNNVREITYRIRQIMLDTVIV